ncbi:hypothetical protein BV898_01434 [Hypsibius exemplaris]|uniref:Ricin B lectin domain-containing protein n=1 Tax=Hypsibius exemplaris TaxID=2072580 RepID=A0A1W0XBF2_HYPEX|nr:hypothetical protein BV898_01434 [Hypsibius exemplaris]
MAQTSPPAGAVPKANFPLERKANFNPNWPFVIRHVETNTVLDVFEGPNSQRIVLYEYNGGGNQLFTFRDGLIISQKNGLVLDVSQHPEDGQALITFNANGGRNQQWQLREYGRIKSQVGQVVDVRTSAPPIYPLLSAYATDQREPSDGGDSQIFELINV